MIHGITPNSFVVFQPAPFFLEPFKPPSRFVTILVTLIIHYDFLLRIFEEFMKGSIIRYSFSVTINNETLLLRYVLT